MDDVLVAGERQDAELNHQGYRVYQHEVSVRCTYSDFYLLLTAGPEFLGATRREQILHRSRLPPFFSDT